MRHPGIEMHHSYAVRRENGIEFRTWDLCPESNRTARGMVNGRFPRAVGEARRPVRSFIFTQCVRGR